MIEVGGTVAPGFEGVATAVRRLIHDGEERGCAVAVYKDGKPVVDIWAGMADDAPWREDTVAVTFSTTKGISALCMMMLHDRGVLDVDAPVSRYWPEYAAAGKSGTLVKHILNHTAGMHVFPNYWDVIGPDYKGLDDQELIAERLAEAAPAQEPGTKEMYHALTYGHLAGEVVRRVDGRTVSQFFREEVAEPLGLEFWIGLPDEHTHRLASQYAADPLRGRVATFRRECIEAGRSKVRQGDVFNKLAWPFSILLAHPDIDNPFELSQLSNQSWFPGAELPAANGIGTARALAKLYAALAQGGEIDGHRIVSQDAIRRFTDVREGIGKAVGLGFGVATPFFLAAGAGADAFMSGGAGGTTVLADPTNGLSMAVTKNQMREFSTAGVRLAIALYRGLDRGSAGARARRAALGGMVNNRRVADRIFNGIQQVQALRGIDKANPFEKD